MFGMLNTYFNSIVSPLDVYIKPSRIEYIRIHILSTIQIKEKCFTNFVYKTNFFTILVM